MGGVFGCLVGCDLVVWYFLGDLVGYVVVLVYEEYVVVVDEG